MDEQRAARSAKCPSASPFGSPSARVATSIRAPRTRSCGRTERLGISFSVEISAAVAVNLAFVGADVDGVLAVAVAVHDAGLAGQVSSGKRVITVCRNPSSLPCLAVSHCAH